MGYVVCKECGTRWEADDQPRKCDTCGAFWMSIPLFKDKTDADRLAANIDGREDWLEGQLDLTHPDFRSRFVKNVLDARDQGLELCCVFCGIGVLAVSGEPFSSDETHEAWCPCAGQDANNEAAANAEP